MVEVSEAAKAKARLLADDEFNKARNGSIQLNWTERAFARFIQQVSDAAKDLSDSFKGLHSWQGIVDKTLAPFILPEPVDPLAAAVRETWGYEWDRTEVLRKALAKRGYTITETTNGR